MRRLYEQKLQIPCIDAIGDIADAMAADAVEKEVEACLDIASNLHIPFIRLRAESTADVAAGVENTAALLEKLLPKAEERGVALLVETSGLFCDTAELRNLLDRFASDWLAALWNLSAAYFGAGEQPDVIIKNLGAYVRHVHMNDARRTENGVEFCLLGEG